MKRFPRPSIVTFFLLAVSPTIFGQGNLEDYQRAQRFQPGNLRHLVYIGEVSPHWIEKTNQFCYRKASPSGSEFILVDAEQNTSSPAFDHARLAAALSHAAKQEYSASDLPFSDFEFVDSGKAIRFSIEKVQWNCSLATYECQKNSSQTERSNEALSPDKRWAAFAKEHNLYLRDVSTGTVLQLTH